MPRARVTLATLARSLELSTCTVSKILNLSFDGISYAPETIKRVEEAAQKMGYVADAQARSLRTRKSMLVGFLLPSAQVSVFGALTDYIELALREKGYQVLIVHSHDDEAAEPGLIAALQARSIDGLVWIPSRVKIDPAEVGLRADFPTVILDRPGCSEAMPFVATDNRAAARELAQRVRSMGHRKIAVLNAPAHDLSMGERYAGIRDVFPTHCVTLLEIPNEMAEAKAAMGRLWARATKPSALIALSEPLAMGALAGLRDLSVAMPEELSFAAFDDFPLAAHWSPRITVVRQDLEGMAAETVDLLMSRIKKDPATKAKEVRVTAAIEWRESVVERFDSLESATVPQSIFVES